MTATPDPPATRARRRWWQRVLALLLGFVLLETGARVWLTSFASDRQFTRYMPLSEVPPTQRMYRGHHYLDYCLTEDYRSRDGLNRHNALGYRGAEVEPDKPAGTYRILVLGGSTTYETGIPDWTGSTWVEMQRLLREELGHPQVEVVNAGCGGWTSWESLIDLMFRGLWLDPDLVLVLCGTNDVHARLVPPELYARDNSGYLQQWNPDESLLGRSVVLRLLGTRLGLVRRNDLGDLVQLKHDLEDDDAVLQRNPPTYYAENLRQMVALTRARGAAIGFGTWPWTDLIEGDYTTRDDYQRGFEEINAATIDVAGQLGVPLLDHAAQMPRDVRYWSDGRHANAEGGRLKARFFADFVAAVFLADGGADR